MPQRQIFQHRRRVMIARWAGGIAAHGLLLLAACAAAQQPPSPPLDPVEIILKATTAERLLAEMGPDMPIDAKVARLTDRLVLRDRDQVQAAVTALDMLGQPAVPSIIRRIDDRRPMPVGAISFENRSPNAFEGVRHLSAARVVDALNLILNDITGESAGSIVVDAGPKGVRDSPDLEPQRQAVVNGWRAYLARRGAVPPVPGKSLPSGDGR